MARSMAFCFLLLLSACGSALTIPEDIPITHLPAGQDFVLTLIMDTCSDTCATYEEGSCDVSVNKEKMEIRVDASVGFDANAVDNCVSVCGGEVLAHCDVDPLPAGTYTVKSKGGFSEQIFVE